MKRGKQMASRNVIDRPLNLLTNLSIKNRILLGPGPSNVHQRVADAIYNSSDITHADPQLHHVMTELKDGLRYILQTRNEVTLVISGSGHTGMETAICNVLEAGDNFVSAVSGIWGSRAAEMASKLNCNVFEMKPQKVGTGFKFDDFDKVLNTHKPKMIYVCHGDSSTGVLQQLEWTVDGHRRTLGQLCHENNCLLLVDAVASLLSTPLNVDDLDIDIVFSGSQKCLSSPPGLALITVSDRAMTMIADRTTPVVSYYLDVIKMASAWGCQTEGTKSGHESKVRSFSYHSTHAVSLLIGLREAISIVVETGLENVINKHQETSKFLQEGLLKLGLQLFVNDANQRLPSVTVVNVPVKVNDVHVDELEIRKKLVDKFNIDISGGLGPTAGKVWRIGLMGSNATFEKVNLLLNSLKDVLEMKSKL